MIKKQIHKEEKIFNQRNIPFQISKVIMYFKNQFKNHKGQPDPVPLITGLQGFDKWPVGGSKGEWALLPEIHEGFWVHQLTAAFRD